MADKDVVLDMKQVTKRFPGTLAVDHVDFSVRKGEVHALMGENGAGKSTLMKILAGSFSDYEGTVMVDGKSVTLRTPLEAAQAGVAMMYQELSIAYNRTVAENLYAGSFPGNRGFLNKKQLNVLAIEALSRVSLQDKIDPDTVMKNVSQHEAQLIEMAKVLRKNPKVLVMDEPTSALTNDEIKILFSIINSIKKQGMAIVYITHHLSEVFEIADRVTVLRDGKLIATSSVPEITKEQLVEMMIGKKMSDYKKVNIEEVSKEVVLEVSHLTHYGYIHDISFQLHKGEILGISGLAGSGRTELGRALCGADKVNEGVVRINGKEIRIHSMSQMLNCGLAYLTEDRKTEGLALRLPNQDNILSTIIDRLSRFGFYHKYNQGAIVKEQYDRLSIYPPDPMIDTGNLSGGNQQKVLMAKWLAAQPEILILDEPTRGVDVGAKKLIHETIERLTKEGKSILLLSSDLPELIALSDRVLILRNGHLEGELTQDGSLDENRVLLAANGERSAYSVKY